MIKAINFLGNAEAPGAISNVSAPKAEEAPKADPNDKFVKADDKKPEEAK